jgi:PAS domain S-box-containing protein
VTEGDDPPQKSSSAPNPFSVEAFGAEGSFVNALISGMGEGFLALDSEWRFLAFNPVAEQIFGLARSDVIGRRIWDVSPKLAGTEFDRRYRLVMSEKTTQVFQAHSALKPDQFHEVRLFPFGDGVGATFLDISKSQRINRALLDREAELARVQRIGGVGGMEVSLRDDFPSRRSPEYLHLHGMSLDATYETHEDWVQRLHPEDRAIAESHLLNTIAGKDTQYKAEYRIVRPSDGEVRWIRAVAEIERDELGRAVKMIGAHLDITDRKEAERAAQESEERLRSIADALPLLISYVDKEKRFRFVNRQYEIWFARPLEEIVGRTVSEVFGPQMYETRRPFMERALAGETVSYEAELDRRSGTVITEVVHVSHFDAAERVVGFYAVVLDITERKRAEQALKESEERFRIIADSAPVPIWVSRLDGLRSFVNTAYVNFLGCSFEEALKFDWRTALHPEDLPRILNEQKAGEASLQPFTLEARYKSGDGQWRWIRSESQPRWSASGEHLGFIGVAHDVTHAKEAEQKLTLLNATLERQAEEISAQLAATEALIRTFFEHSSECHAVLVEAEHGRFRYEEVNPAALRLYGKLRGEVIGRTLDEVFGKEESAELNRHLSACVRIGSPQRYERIQSDRIIEAIATPVPNEGGGGRRVVVSAYDVTDRRRLDEQLRQVQKMEAIGQLTGGVAHDFNNLLTIVLGGLDTIGRQIPNLPAPSAMSRIERAHDMALQGVTRAATLTRRLLAFSRQQSLAPQSVDANKLVASTCELLRRTLGETVSLQTKLADGLWRAYADPNELENALLNLAVNARDAMPDGGRLTIETANADLDEALVAGLPERIDPGQYVVIAVSDTGVGMDQETKRRAFDPFFTTKEVGKGTGLGLSQVYGFARQSGGHVKIDSEPGQGSTIGIYLPRRLGVDAEAAAKDAFDPRGALGVETVLVVEDDDSLRTYTTSILRELGYRVVEAAEGVGAIARIEQSNKIDLLLTDIVMPGGMNGRQLAFEATKRRPDLKVLFMTGYPRDAIVHDGRLDAGVHMIGKPFSYQELASRIRARLDARE